MKGLRRFMRLAPFNSVGVLLVLALVAAGAARGAAPTIRAADATATKEGLDFFEKRIRPVLVHNCYECHSGDPAKAKGHLLLDSAEGLRKGGDSGAVIAPGHADSSLLVEAIRYEGLEMPPKGQLSDEVVADFVEWIDMGAPDPRVGKAAKPKGKIDLAEARKFWAFQLPKVARPPEVNDSRWPHNNIDKFVRARQEQEHLDPVHDADRITLIRRVTFDLTGLPPTPAEVDAFVKDPSAGALTTVVDRLLDSPRFGERWARHWFDVVHYAESSGKERNVPFRYAWRYRDYVIDSLNADKPYDRFIIEQLAGDLLPARGPKEKNEHLIATGFLALGPKAVNVRNPEQFAMDVIDDQIDVTGRALLGMTIACARCHDHKFDPIPTTDYYAMAGIFRSTEMLGGVEPGKKAAIDNRLIALADTDKSPKPSAEDLRALQAHQREIAQVESQIDELRKLQRQANRKNLPNRGKGKGKPPPPPPQVNGQAVREQIKELQDKLDKLEAERTPVANLAMGVLESASPTNCQVLVRGELKDKGPEVPRGVLTVLKTPQASRIDPRHSGRFALAQWIASKNNPLTARVLVNRVWEHLFGQGLVESVDNFGALGNEPSHPELLDTLAVQFMEEGWSIKKLIRAIVLSHVYQLSSDHNAKNYEQDPSNRFLWRMERRRLDAEEIRDAMLAASGQLVFERPEGSPVMELDNGPIRGKEMQEVRKPTTVRSIYLPVIRGNLPDMLQVFDAADPSLIVGKRDVTTVPTQALFLMNNPFVLQQSSEMAKRILAEKDRDQATRIELAYRFALSRLATERERASVAKYLNEYRKALEDSGHKGNPQFAAWTSFCQTLFQSGEFRYVY
jgi:hypothetical protein